MHTFGCMKHHCNLDGTPRMVIIRESKAIRVWDFTLVDMVCPLADDDERRTCEKSWRVGEA